MLALRSIDMMSTDWPLMPSHSEDLFDILNKNLTEFSFKVHLSN